MLKTESLWPYYLVAALAALLYGGLLRAQPPAQPDALPPFAALVTYGTTAGSGTVVGHGGGTSLVLTCKHFGFHEGDRVTVRVAGESHPGTVLALCPDADLAALRIEGECWAAVVADAEPPAGGWVRQWGCGGTGQPRLKTGRWRGGWDGVIVGTPHVLRVDATTIPSESGDSGTGVFDYDGRLVGVGTHGGGGSQCVAPLTRIRPFLRPFLNAQASAPPASPAAAPPTKMPQPKSGPASPVKPTVPAKPAVAPRPSASVTVPSATTTVHVRTASGPHPRLTMAAGVVREAGHAVVWHVFHPLGGRLRGCR